MLPYRSLLCALFAAGAAVLMSCTHSHDHGADYKADACKHMQDGPARSVAAAESRTDDLPDVGAAHTRFDIALANVSGSREGFVAFEADEEADFHFALSGEATLEITDAAGAVMPREGAVDTEGGCGEVKAIHTYELEPGRYVLHFQSGNEVSVSLVTVEGGVHAH